MSSRLIFTCCHLPPGTRGNWQELAHWGAGPDPLPNAHPTYWSTPVLQYARTRQRNRGAPRTRGNQSTLARTGAPSWTRQPNAHPTSEPVGCGLNPTALSPTPVLQYSSIPVLQDPTTQHPTSADQRGIAHNGAHWGAVPDPLSQRAPDFGTVRSRAEPHCPLSNQYSRTRQRNTRPARTRAHQRGMARTGAPPRTRYPNAHPTSEPFGCGLNPAALSPTTTM